MGHHWLGIILYYLGFISWILIGISIISFIEGLWRKDWKEVKISVTIISLVGIFYLILPYLTI